MPRGKHCRNFQWRDEDAAYLAERKNDRVVFRKIRREQLKNRKTARIIRGLFLSPLWAPRMTGKSAESWRGNRALACVRGRFIRKREYRYSSSPS